MGCTGNMLLSESEIQIPISVHNMAQWLSMGFDIIALKLLLLQYSSFAKRVVGSIICFDIYYFIDILHILCVLLFL